MADLAITPTSVLKAAGHTLRTGTLGEACDAGDVLYLAIDGSWYKAFRNGTALQASAGGIALNGGAANQHVTIQTGGLIAIGGTVVTGETYLLSRRKGKLEPISDTENGVSSAIEHVTYLGAAEMSLLLRLRPNATSVFMPKDVAEHPLSSVTSNGTFATIVCESPHRLYGDEVILIADVDPSLNGTYSGLLAEFAVVDPVTFTIPSPFEIEESSGNWSFP